MFTSFKTLDSVVGGWLFLAVCLVSLAVGVVLARKCRGDLLAVALSAVLGDAAWYLLYFPRGEYREFGLAAVFGLLLYPACIGMGLIVAKFWRKNEVCFMEENMRSKHFPTGKREIRYGLTVLLFSLLMADTLLYGGLNLGFCLMALVLTAVSWLYLGRRLTGYTGALLILECVITGSFLRSDDGLIKFAMLIFALTAGNLGLMLTAGKNQHRPGGLLSLLDVPQALVLMGVGDLDKSFGGLNDARKNAGTLGKKNLAVLAGLGIAIPVLAVLIPLLMQADAAFEGLLKLLPQLDFSELVLVLICGIPTACVLYTRNTALRHKPAPEHGEKAPKTIHRLTVTTVLILVSVLYLVYLFSQLAYFVGGLAGILPEEYTLAQYARRGFFEMAWLSGINLAIIALAVGLTEKKEGRTPLAVKLLCLFIALMTIFFVTAASGKMLLYIGSFGLTRLRVLTQVSMVFIGITVIFVAVWLFAPKFAYMKAVILTALIIGAGMAWADVDTVVAAYNVGAYQAGTLETVDISHLTGLGDGAVPYLHKLTRDPDAALAKQAKEALIRRAEQERSDIRSWNIAAAQAEKILAEYESQVPEFQFTVSPAHVPVDYLVSRLYRHEELQSILSFGGGLPELDARYPMDCVRLHGDHYRVVYLGYDEIAVVEFDWALNVIDRQLHSLSSFQEELLEIGGGCDLALVKEISPAGVFGDGYSDHYTLDGYWFHYEYDENGIITHVKVELI